MCGTLFGICRIIFLGVENDTLSCLDLLNMGICFHLLSFVVLQYLVYPTLYLLCKVWHSLLAVVQSQNTTVVILSESEHNCGHAAVHPLLKTTLTGLRRTYLRFLVFRPKLGETKRFPPFLDHMIGKFFLGDSRFWSGKIDPKLAVGGSWPHNHGQEL